MLQRDRWSASQPTIGPGPMSNGCALIVIDVVARAPGMHHYESIRHPSPSSILAVLPREWRGWVAPRRQAQVDWPSSFLILFLHSRQQGCPDVAAGSVGPLQGRGGAGPIRNGSVMIVINWVARLATMHHCRSPLHPSCSYSLRPLAVDRPRGAPAHPPRPCAVLCPDCAGFPRKVAQYSGLGPPREFDRFLVFLP